MKHRLAPAGLLLSALLLLPLACGDGTPPPTPDPAIPSAPAPSTPPAPTAPSGAGPLAVTPGGSSFVVPPALDRMLSRPLREHLARAPDAEFVPILVQLPARLSEAARRDRLAPVRDLPGRKRRAAARELLSEALRDFAQSEYGALRDQLEAHSDVRAVRPMWIASALSLQVKRRALLDLTFPEGTVLHLDRPRRVKQSVAWGATHIGAPQVWDANYDGTGVVVAVLDSGVDLDHPGLAAKLWINTKEDLDGDGLFTDQDIDGKDQDWNGYPDDVVGWNFGGSHDCAPDTPATQAHTCYPDDADPSGHGTHVAGTIAGDAQARARFAIKVYGVAPGARIMALRETDASSLSTQTTNMLAMQYALANGADVVNLSSGWRADMSPAYELWREAVENLTDAGVLFVTVSGNDSDLPGEPDSVRTPGRVPLALTVGATGSQDEVWGMSNPGPVTWQTVPAYGDYPWPPGLLKPDVTAPGHRIVSTQRSSSYTEKSGTSMAAPHVSGLAALLLQQQPDLGPYELRYLIEETALDVDANGPDRRYGWGRIDAVAAIAAAIPAADYDLAPGSGPGEDGRPVWIDNDDDGTPDPIQPGETNHLYGSVRNLGGGVVGEVELSFWAGHLAAPGADAEGGGEPSAGGFALLGRYVVPVLGPAGSRHEQGIGVLHWSAPAAPEPGLCISLAADAFALNPPEANTTNNFAACTPLAPAE